MTIQTKIQSITGGKGRALLMPLLAVAAVSLAGCGSSATAGGSTTQPSSSPAPAGPPKVVLSEWKVDVPSTIKADKVTFTIKNTGSVEHELLVFKSDLSPSQYPLTDSGNINEEATSIAKISDGENLVAGASQQRIIDLSTPGKYLFVCNLPSHFGQGMQTLVTVTP